MSCALPGGGEALLFDIFNRRPGPVVRQMAQQASSTLDVGGGGGGRGEKPGSVDCRRVECGWHGVGAFDT
jgi:hypothetical protein